MGARGVEFGTNSFDSGLRWDELDGGFSTECFEYTGDRDAMRPRVVVKGEECCCGTKVTASGSNFGSNFTGRVTDIELLMGGWSTLTPL